MILVEHAHVKQEADTVVFEAAENGVFRTFNIPHVNCSIVLLGEGTSITRDAVRTLASSDTLIAFCGGGGSPLLAGITNDFLPVTPTSEYRPTEYMQIWAKRFFEESLRLETAKDLLIERYKKTKELWDKLQLLGLDGSRVPNRSFVQEVRNATSSVELLLTEARHAKEIYAVVAREAGDPNFVREQGGTDRVSPNGLLDHANYLAYGVAAVALHALGISSAFPALHGKTRRGGLVFDIADLIKDGITVPLAFSCNDDKQLRYELIEILHDEEIVAYLCDQTKRILCGK